MLRIGVCVLAALAAPIAAQVTTATFYGVLADSSGSAVPVNSA